MIGIMGKMRPAPPMTPIAPMTPILPMTPIIPITPPRPRKTGALPKIKLALSLPNGALL